MYISIVRRQKRTQIRGSSSCIRQRRLTIELLYSIWLRLSKQETDWVQPGESSTEYLPADEGAHSGVQYSYDKMKFDLFACLYKCQ